MTFDEPADAPGPDLDDPTRERATLSAAYGEFIPRMAAALAGYPAADLSAANVLIGVLFERAALAERSHAVTAALLRQSVEATSSLGEVVAALQGRLDELESGPGDGPRPDPADPVPPGPRARRHLRSCLN